MKQNDNCRAIAEKEMAQVVVGDGLEKKILRMSGKLEFECDCTEKDFC